MLILITELTGNASFILLWKKPHFIEKTIFSKQPKMQVKAALFCIFANLSNDRTAGFFMSCFCIWFAIIGCFRWGVWKNSSHTQVEKVSLCRPPQRWGHTGVAGPHLRNNSVNCFLGMDVWELESGRDYKKAPGTLGEWRMRSLSRWRWCLCGHMKHMLFDVCQLYRIEAVKK